MNVKNIVNKRITRVARVYYVEFWDLKGLGQILHELIKRELIRICLEIGFIPLPEIKNPKKESKGREKAGRLDMMFWDEKKNLPVFVFEIDQGIKKESIKKLKMHGELINKCIILFGDVSVNKKLEDKDIYFLDVTKRKILAGFDYQF